MKMKKLNSSPKEKKSKLLHQSYKKMIKEGKDRLYND